MTMRNSSMYLVCIYTKNNIRYIYICCMIVRYIEIASPFLSFERFTCGKVYYDKWMISNSFVIYDMCHGQKSLYWGWSSHL